MKPIPISLSPTRSRALNVFLGAVQTLASILLFLALATYHPSDASMNTASGADAGNAVHNWIGVLGAYLSDILLQAFGVTAFLVPVWMVGLGWNWIRSRAAGTAILRWMGVALSVIFTPALFGLLPWHWRWMHAVPVEGVMGRVISGLLVAYLNTQGAWLVAVALAGVGLYFGSDISFRKLKTQIVSQSCDARIFDASLRLELVSRNHRARIDLHYLPAHIELCAFLHQHLRFVAQRILAHHLRPGPQIQQRTRRQLEPAYMLRRHRDRLFIHIRPLMDRNTVRRTS